MLGARFQLQSQKVMDDRGLSSSARPWVRAARPCPGADWVLCEGCARLDKHGSFTRWREVASKGLTPELSPVWNGAREADWIALQSRVLCFHCWLLAVFAGCLLLTQGGGGQSSTDGSDFRRCSYGFHSAVSGRSRRSVARNPKQLRFHRARGALSLPAGAERVSRTAASGDLARAESGPLLPGAGPAKLQLKRGVGLLAAQR